MTALSGSKVELAMACVGGFAMPGVDSRHAAADRGTVIHQFLEDVMRHGPKAALAAVPESHRIECEAIDLRPILEIASQGRVRLEPTLAYSPWTDKARFIGESLNRDYSTIAEGEFPATADVIVLKADSTGIVADYKTGRWEVERASENWQLKALAVAASRAFDLSAVRVGILKLREDGTWYQDWHELDVLDLDGAAADLRRLMERIERAKTAYAAGKPLPLVTGEHCRWCPSKSYCPAQTAIVRAFAPLADVAKEGGDIAVNRALAQLTPVEAGVAWLNIEVLEKLIEHAKRQIELRAEEEEIPLPDGRVLMKTDSSREYINGNVAVRVLRELHGAEVAEKCCETKIVTSKDAIQRALPGKVGRAAIEAIRRAGGANAKTYTKIQAVKPGRG